MGDFFLIVFLSLLMALGMLGWVWLLHFPWDWAWQAALIVQGILLLMLWMGEFSALSVNGAGGWTSFGYFFLQLFLFAGLGIVRLLVAVGQFIAWL